MMIPAANTEANILYYILVFAIASLDLSELCNAESVQQESVNSNGWFGHVSCMLSKSCHHEPGSSDPAVEDELEHSKKWDILVFTRTFANTLCFVWEEESPSKNSCHMPPDNNTWTIHGIWPTRLGTREPSYCNSSAHFNVTQLSSIVDSLNRYWTNIELPSRNTTLWKHEWDKHGTCAASLPALNTETKYFGKGLDWHKNYNMTSILEKGGVVPNSKVPTNRTSIYQAVKKALNVNSAIDCIYDKRTSRNYLYEIMICLDKSLKLIDCDGIKYDLDEKPLGNCPLNADIYLPDSVPPIQRE